MVCGDAIRAARRAAGVPVFDEPDRKAKWKLTLEVPAAMRAFSNMPVEAERATATGWREVTFQRTPPLPSYLVAFAVGEFDVRDGGEAGQNRTPISIVTPKGRAAEAEYAAANTGAILAATERYFGHPYPFPKLDLLAYPKSTFGGAMENPGLITYTAQILLARPDEISPIFEQRFVGVTAHEIAHMWFGDYVTMAWWNDLWLNEVVRVVDGEHDHGGVAPGLADAAGARANAARRWNSIACSTARRIRQPVTEYGEVRAAFDSITYAKGESMLAMFEQWLGPDKFREGVRRYIAKYAWGNATAEDFFAALGRHRRRPGARVARVCRTRGRAAARRRRSIAAPRRRSRWRSSASCRSARPRRWRALGVSRLLRVRRREPRPGGLHARARRDADGAAADDRLPAMGRRQSHRARLLPAAPHARVVRRAAEGGARAGRRRLRVLLGDMEILARSGAIGYEEVLPRRRTAGDNPDPRAARRAFDLADSVPSALVDAANDAKFAAWIRRNFGVTRARSGLAAEQRRHARVVAAARNGAAAGGRARPGRRACAGGATARATLAHPSQGDPAGHAQDRARRPPRARRARTRHACSTRCWPSPDRQGPERA